MKGDASCKYNQSRSNLITDDLIACSMWNEPSSSDLAALPGLYETEDKSLDKKIIHMHFFLGGCDWYASEYGHNERIFFGYAILNDDLLNSEWGNFSFDELRSINIRGLEVDRDLHWEPCKAIEVDRIKKAYEKYR